MTSYRGKWKCNIKLLAWYGSAVVYGILGCLCALIWEWKYWGCESAFLGYRYWDLVRTLICTVGGGVRVYVNMYCVLILFMTQIRRKIHFIYIFFSCNIDKINIFFLHMIVLYEIIFKGCHWILRFQKSYFVNHVNWPVENLKVCQKWMQRSVIDSCEKLC